MYKKLIVGCLGVILLQAKGTETLVVGTNGEFPPFAYIENKTLVGFDIDVAKEVAKRLAKTIQFKDMPFEALIPELTLGQIDVVAAGMSLTEERAKRVAFTKSYLPEDPLVIFSKHPLKLEELRGKTVVVIEGFTADLFISSQKGIHLIRLPSQADGFMAMKSGRADAFITARSTIDAFLKVQEAAQFHITAIEGTAETCALVVPKNNPQILAEVQKALDEMSTDGTMAYLKAKWMFK
jgi:ABC-type amino acid transport substrate-binding protein